MTTELETAFDDGLVAELEAMLHAHAGPAEPLRRPVRRSVRRPARPFAVGAAATFLALGAGAAVLLWEHGGEGGSAGLRHVELPALPAGPEKLPPTESLGMVVALTFEEAVAQADAVFVGTVEAIGGRETVDGLVLRRIRYAVEDVLRGERVDTVDVTAIESFSHGFAAEVGTTYLVLAEETEVGQGGVVALVPVGAAQGVYEVVAGTATNALTGESIRIDELAELVGTGR